MATEALFFCTWGTALKLKKSPTLCGGFFSNNINLNVAWGEGWVENLVGTFAPTHR
jgi:hypothetical protein